MDTTRGLALIAVLVSLAITDLGDLPEVFHPSAWHGFRPADLVAPTLLVVSGVALAMTRLRHRSGRAAALRLGRRVAVLAAIAAVLDLVERGTWVDWAPAVLWDSPLVQLATVWLVVWGLASLRRTVQIGTAALLLAANWYALSRLDPSEGILVAVLPTMVVTVLAGYWLGDWLRARPDGPATAIAMALTGGYAVATGVVGAQVLALNRTLMTATFVVFSVGLALVLIAAVYTLVTVLPAERALAKVTRLGRHAFVAYLATAAITLGLGAGEQGSRWQAVLDGFRATFGPELGALVLAGVVVAVAMATAGVLERRGYALRP